MVRAYDPERDADAVHRIWCEIGWISADSDREREMLLDHFYRSGRAIVAELDGQAELAVTTADGTLRHGATDLSMSAVTSVTASHLARQGGLASSMTARAVATDAAAGLQTASLGIFDQGFYDRLGFGTGSYLRRYRFDPATLRVPRGSRRPVRLNRDDAEEVHANRLATERRHGAVTITSAEFSAAEMGWEDNAFGLGFRDSSGALTHHVWFSADEMEEGPYNVEWLAYRSADDLRELFSLMRSLGDQVQRVSVPEPPGLLVQHLLDRPFRSASYTSDKQALGGRGRAWWQCRMLDVEAGVAAARFVGDGVGFVLELDDPIATHLPAELPWRGVGGRYVVDLGASSSAQRSDGRTDLPVLRCSVGTFTRLWLGVAPATRLPLTDELDAPDSLLEQLDDVIRVPEPLPNFPF